MYAGGLIMRMHHAARCGVPMHMHDPRGCNPSRTVRRPAVMRPRAMFLTRRYLQSPRSVPQGDAGAHCDANANADDHRSALTTRIASSSDASDWVIHVSPRPSFLKMIMMFVTVRTYASGCGGHNRSRPELEKASRNGWSVVSGGVHHRMPVSFDCRDS